MMKTKKIIMKLMGLLTILGSISDTAYAKGSLPGLSDNAHLLCTIIFENGQVAQGNGKSDLCLFYENIEGVNVVYHTAFNSYNIDNFLCETEDNDFIYVEKEIFRIDNYTVHAFGYEYGGIKGSSLGIIDHLIVKNKIKDAKINDPVSIVFQSDFMGKPKSISVHILGGRAPLFKKIKCDKL